MKRYIVTEDDLDNLIDMARDYGQNHGLNPADAVFLSQARADCTKLEVPDGDFTLRGDVVYKLEPYGTATASVPDMRWAGYPVSSDEL